MLERGENKEVLCILNWMDCGIILVFSDFLLTSDYYPQYLPIEGLAAFNKVTAELLFGADNPVIEQKRVCVILKILLFRSQIIIYFPDPFQGPS